MLDYSLYNGQSLVSTCDVVCVGNGKILNFSQDGKLDLQVLVKNIYPVLKNKSSVLFIEYTEINKKIIYNWLLYLYFLG